MGLFHREDNQVPGQGSKLVEPSKRNMVLLLGSGSLKVGENLNFCSKVIIPLLVQCSTNFYQHLRFVQLCETLDSVREKGSPMS